MPKTDPATIADRLSKAREREQHCAIILAKRGTRHARVQMRRSMDAVLKLQREAEQQARAAHRARVAAELMEKVDSDLVAALHSLTEGRR